MADPSPTIIFTEEKNRQQIWLFENRPLQRHSMDTYDFTSVFKGMLGETQDIVSGPNRLTANSSVGCHGFLVSVY